MTLFSRLAFWRLWRPVVPAQVPIEAKVRRSFLRGACPSCGALDVALRRDGQANRRFHQCPVVRWCAPDPAAQTPEAEG